MFSPWLFCNTGLQNAQCNQNDKNGGELRLSKLRNTFLQKLDLHHVYFSSEFSRSLVFFL